MSSTGEVVTITDDLREGLVAESRAALGDAVLDSYIRPGLDVWVRVRSEDWAQTVNTIRTKLAFDFFDFLSAIDWMPSPYGKGEDDPTAEPVVRSTEVIQGHAGGETRFQVICRLASSTRKIGITLKVDVPESMTLTTLVPVFAGANWHERETREMFGITFEGHPYPVNLYLPTEFEGHPLRKDFPLLARMVKPWPGIVDVEPIPAEFDTDGGDES